MAKKIIIFFAGLVVLVLVAAGIALWKINPIVETFRPKIEQLASDAVKQPVKLGEIGVRFFPKFALQIESASIGDTNAKYKAKTGEILFSAKLGDLLSGKLAVENIGVKSPVIDIVKTPKGLQIGSLPLTQQKPDEAKPASQHPAGDKKEMDFQIKEVKLEDGRIRFIDETVTPAREIAFDDIDIDVTEIALPTSADVALAANAFGGSGQNITLDTSIRPGTSGAVPVAKLKLGLRDLQLQQLMALAKSHGTDLSDKLDPAGRTLTLEIIGNNAPGILGGHIETFSIVTGKSRIDIPADVNLAAISAKVKATLDLTEIGQMAKAAAPFKPSGKLETDLSIKADQSNLALAEINGPITFDHIAATLAPTALELKDLVGRLVFEKGAMRLDGTSLDLEGQKLLVSGKLGQPAELHPTLNIKSKRLELEPILKKMSPDAFGMAGSYLTDLNVALDYNLATKSGPLNIAFGASQLKGYPLESAAIGIVANPERIDIKPTKLGIFGGTIGLSGNFLPNTKTFSMMVAAARLDVSKLIKPTGKFSLSGTVSSFKTNMSGSTSAIPNSLSGPIDLSIEKGAIEGFNFLKAVLEKINNIPGLGTALIAFVPPKYQPLVTTDRTEFDRLAFKGSLSGGVVTVESLSLEHRLYSVTGAGTVELAGNLNLRVQLHIQPELAQEMVAREGKLRLLLDKNNSIVFPVVIQKRGGPVIVLPDLGDLLKRGVTNTAKQAVERELQKRVPGLGDAAKGVLDSLF